MTYATEVARQGEFDYGELGDAGDRARQRTADIKRTLRRTAEDLVGVGLLLREARADMPSHAYLRWLDAEFGWGVSQAQRFVAVAEKFGGATNLHLMAPTALLLLVSPGTPEIARDAATQLAEGGTRITPGVAKELVATAKDLTHGEDATLFRGKVTSLVPIDKPATAEDVERLTRLVEGSLSPQGLARLRREEIEANDAKDRARQLRDREVSARERLDRGKEYLRLAQRSFERIDGAAAADVARLCREALEAAEGL